MISACRMVLIAVLIVGTISAVDAQESTNRPNVLFIAIDDLRPELGCYGDSHIHSPNIDKLAVSGRLFEHAYCQQAVCNPSRTSLMTGMRPDSTGVVGNHSHFRPHLPDVVTLPQHFKNHGYHAAAIGKIYHGVFPDGASRTKWDTMGDPESWSEPALRFGPRYYYTEEGIAAAKRVYQQVYKPVNPGPDDWTKKLVFGPATESPDVPDSTLYDGQVADASVRKLQKLKGDDRPFFLAVGFIKPHSPYIAPKKYFDIYEDVSLPTQTEFPAEAPAIAGHGSGELRRYTDQPNSGVITDANQRRVRHAYFACISFIDAQIGRVLNELDRLGLGENTIVVLFGDHGYHLGEQGLWGKTTNFELDTRVPLIVRVPGMKTTGKSSASLVELVDLYPTLAELAGLPITEQLEGRSFAPILNDPNHDTKTAALSQYPRGGGLMGYSMRTATYRLTQWVHRQTGEVQATELYDYSDGLVETKNIVGEEPDLVERLSAQLHAVAAVTRRRVDAENDKGDGADVHALASVATSATTSFEKAKAGPIDQLDTAIGTWMPDSGRTIVDDKHAKTGKHCLQLTGGKKTSVVLRLADDVDTTGVLTFWAERWTSRSPFSFRVDGRAGDDWIEVFNGDRSVRVGRSFLNHVKIPLGDENVEQLRFTVVSPPSTGVLIDDIRIAPAQPQKLVGVESVPFALPALVGTESSPLVKLRVETTGVLNPISVTQMRGTLDGTTDRSELKSLYVRSGETRQETQPSPDGSFTFSLPESSGPLVEGENLIWVGCKLRQDANIDHRAGAAITEVTFSTGQTVKLDAPPSIQRIGVAVRNGGDDGVHTYRIPGLTTTNKGTLIGVYDVRRRGGGDLPGDIDIAMSRSINGGRTWEPMKIIMDMGDDPDWHYDGIGDPALLVDRGTGTIWVAATWSHGNRSWRGSGPGLEPEETGQLMLVRSDDDGVTWSEPINITKQVKRPEWCFILQGPGKGITMRDGTIVFAAQYQDPPEENRLPHSTIIYSKDHGETWHVGTGAFDDTTESQVVEVEPGVLMLNCRYNREPVRVVMTTRDMGKTWQKHTTSERALIEPGACMASLIDVDMKTVRSWSRKTSDGSLDESRTLASPATGWLLFSNPDSTHGRHHITIKVSPDRGLTWPKEHRLLLDEGTGRGYSCMTMIDERTVGILYEGSQAHMTFQRIPLGDLIGEAEPSKPASAVESRLRLPRVFSNHMVLQAEAEIPVWGRAKPGATVTVTLGDDTRTATAGGQGQWRVRLKPRKACATPRTMWIQSEDERIEFTDVLIGEVWVCAGQSNMEWTLQQSAHGKEELAGLVAEVAGSSGKPRETELLASSATKSLRLLNLSGGARGSSGSYAPEHLARLTPQTFCEGQWQIASAESAASFSAVAWYFGRHLQPELNVPIGLICPAVGGTPAEAWISREALAADPQMTGLLAGNWLDNPLLGEFCRTRGEQNLLSAIQAGEAIPGDDLGPNHSFKPGFMWDAGIEPLLPYAIRGAIWYQGESNAETPSRVREHGRLLPLLINQWREQWGQGDFPFLYVQLPALNRPEWPWFRDGQRRVLSQLDNVGMAITIDTGHPTNVHPTAKKPVGERLAKWALGTTYGLPIDAYSGPLLDVAQRKGDSMVVSFTHTGGGLKSSDGNTLRYFEIRGDDGVFHPANARITGKNTVSVSGPRVAEPQHVRYAWLPFPNPPVNLFNSANLPASPFSTESEEVLFARREEALEGKTMHGHRPSILLIVGEDHGCELSCYGDSIIKTPNIDRLASQGVLFENGYVTQSVCSPSRSTIFTGLYPHQNGQLGLATHQYGWFKKWPTTYSLLKKAGYRTGLIGKTHVIPADAVEPFVDFRFQESSNFAKRRVGDYAVKAGEFFRAGDEPFFMTVNYPDAHWPLQGQVDGLPETQVDPKRVQVMPYVGDETPRLREVVRNYYDCMLRLDACVGQLLKQLEESGKADNTLVVFVSDHGAQVARGKVTVCEGGMRVPYIVRWPGVVKPNLRSKALVSTIDLLPTFMDAAGLPAPIGLPGRSLRPAVQGAADGEFREYLACERNCDAARHTFPQRTIRDARYKLIHSPVRDREDPAARYYRVHGASHWAGCLTDEELAGVSEETRAGYARWLNPPEYQLYDLQHDPHEWTDLSGDPKHADVGLRLQNALKQWQADTRDPLADPEKLRLLMEENDAVAQAKRRSPKDGWQYLKYLAPDSAQVIFQQRDRTQTLITIGIHDVGNDSSGEDR